MTMTRSAGFPFALSTLDSLTCLRKNTACLDAAASWVSSAGKWIWVRRAWIHGGRALVRGASLSGTVLTSVSVVWNRPGGCEI